MLSLGAINKLTGEYVFPKIANKNGEYSCPVCYKDLILCQGTKRVHHFRHKVDCIDPCRHYNNPTETQIHKDAKFLLKNLLERKIPISFIRNCDCCKKNEEFEIPEISEGSNIQLEYRFEHNGVKVADVAYLEDGKILCIFEICNTHRTCSENRPEPWFEIDALTLIKLANDSDLVSLQIPCIRREKCEACIERENKNLKHYNIEKYVRVKLGQKIFPTPIPKVCTTKKLPLTCEDGTIFYENCKSCDNCLYNSEWYNKVWKSEGHLRVQFDARKDIKENKEILDLFDEDFINKKVIFHSHKGRAHAYIISKLGCNKYDNNWIFGGKKYDNYWDVRWFYDDCDGLSRVPFPCEKIIDITAMSTINIILELIKYCKGKRELFYMHNLCKQTLIK